MSAPSRVGAPRRRTFPGYAVLCPFRLLLVSLLALACLSPAPLLQAQHHPPSEGWDWLFNGRNLAGWRKAREPMVDPRWTVEDEALTNLPDARDIASTTDYRDFELSLDYRTVPAGNSGVFLRGRIEIQIFDSYGQSVPSSSDDGAVYGQLAPRVNAARPAGSWNTLWIRLEGATLTAKLNGQLIHDRVTLTRVCGGALPGGLLDPGPIRLQGDHGKVWFRRVYIRPLTTSPANVIRP